jgi:hypothetical protein
MLYITQFITTFVFYKIKSLKIIVVMKTIKILSICSLILINACVIGAVQIYEIEQRTQLILGAGLGIANLIGIAGIIIIFVLSQKRKI